MENATTDVQAKMAAKKKDDVDGCLMHRPEVLTRRKKVWIDLDNSPHVPFFMPIVEELQSRGYPVFITARDCFQVCELADLLGLRYNRVGRHYGKNFVFKLAGLGVRALQMFPAVLREKPTLAVSHGSRSQLVTARMLRIPSVTIGDYEYSKLFVGLHPDWLLVPEVIPDEAVKHFGTPVLKYPGIKEDVYAARFKPQPEIVDQLQLNGGNLIVTIRPPANEAHYHVAETEVLFQEVLTYVAAQANVKIVLLPRNARQAASIRSARPELFLSGKVMIPEHVVDGLNLIWYSDLVISGGGTMNREAAALGVPVYSIFRGKIGAVDQYLERNGRLVLIESVNEIRSKLLLKHRDRRTSPAGSRSDALGSIVEHLVSIGEGIC